jgi:hypothetical protein
MYIRPHFCKCPGCFPVDESVLVENLKAPKAAKYKSNLAEIEGGFEFNELAR